MVHLNDVRVMRFLSASSFAWKYVPRDFHNSSDFFKSSSLYEKANESDQARPDSP